MARLAQKFLSELTKEMLVEDGETTRPNVHRVSSWLVKEDLGMIWQALFLHLLQLIFSC